MAWLEKRKADDGTIRYRLRAHIGGKKITVIKDLGIWKEGAQESKIKFHKAVKAGFAFTPPIHVAVIDAFLKARAEGKDVPDQIKRLLIPEMCDLYIEKQGPSFKGGISTFHHSPYNLLRLRLEMLKRAWADKYADQITKLDVRDFLAPHRNVGYRLRQIGAYGAMFRCFEEWNKEENILPWKVRLPPYNPFSKYRKTLKPAQKKELPDTRVLSEEEWNRFQVHLTPHARAICELALRRFLRLSDIRAINGKTIVNGNLRGFQEKTGFEYIVPALANQPEKYNFKNFRRAFRRAQKAAGLDFPADHPLHFSVKDLRRTGATWAYRRTKDLVGISAMLGHEDISTTRRYLNIDKADLAAIARVMDEMAGGSNELTAI